MSTEALRKLQAALLCLPEDKLTKLRAASSGSLKQLWKLTRSAEDKATLLPKLCCLGYVSVQVTSQRLAGVQCPGSSVTLQQRFEQLLNPFVRDITELR